MKNTCLLHHCVPWNLRVKVFFFFFVVSEMFFRTMKQFPRCHVRAGNRIGLLLSFDMNMHIQFYRIQEKSNTNYIIFLRLWNKYQKHTFQKSWLHLVNTFKLPLVPEHYITDGCGVHEVICMQSYFSCMFIIYTLIQMPWYTSAQVFQSSFFFWTKNEQ